MKFMKKLLVCNVVLLCTLASAQADDLTPTIHLDKFYTTAEDRGALATLDQHGAVRQSSAKVEDVIAMKEKIKELIKTQEKQTDTLNQLAQKLSKNGDTINNLQRSLDEANRKIIDQQRALEQVSSKIK